MADNIVDTLHPDDREMLRSRLQTLVSSGKLNAQQEANARVAIERFGGFDKDFVPPAPRAPMPLGLSKLSETPEYGQAYGHLYYQNASQADLDAFDLTDANTITRKDLGAYRDQLATASTEQHLGEELEQTGVPGAIRFTKGVGRSAKADAKQLAATFQGKATQNLPEYKKEKLKAGSEVLSGAGGMATPLIAGSFVTQPIRTAVALTASGVASETTVQELKARGFSPEAQEFGGNFAGMLPLTDPILHGVEAFRSPKLEEAKQKSTAPIQGKLVAETPASVAESGAVPQEQAGTAQPPSKAQQAVKPAPTPISPKTETFAQSMAEVEQMGERRLRRMRMELDAARDFIKRAEVVPGFKEGFEQAMQAGPQAFAEFMVKFNAEHGETLFPKNEGVAPSETAPGFGSTLAKSRFFEFDDRGVREVKSSIPPSRFNKFLGSNPEKLFVVADSEGRIAYARGRGDLMTKHLDAFDRLRLPIPLPQRQTSQRDDRQLSKPGEPLTDYEFAKLSKQLDKARELGDTAAADALAGILDAQKEKRQKPAGAQVQGPRPSPAAKPEASGAQPTAEQTVAAGGNGALSSEEISRPGQFYHVSPSGDITFLGKQPDISPALEKRGGSVARVFSDGSFEPYQGSNPATLNKYSRKLASVIRAEKVGPGTGEDMAKGIEPVKQTDQAKATELQAKLGDLQERYLTNKKMLAKHDQAVAKGHERGLLRDNQVAFLNKDNARLEKQIKATQTEYHAALGDADARTLLGDLKTARDTTLKGKQFLDNLVASDTVAKELRDQLPTSIKAEKRAIHQALGDVQDQSKPYIQRLQRYTTPRQKAQVEEAHEFIRKELQKIKADVDSGVIPAINPEIISQYESILENKTPVIINYPFRKGQGKSILPEISLRTLQTITGKKPRTLIGDERSLSPEDRAAREQLRELKAVDPKAAKELIREQNREPIRAAADKLQQKAEVINRSIENLSKVSGVQEKINREVLTDLVSGKRQLEHLSSDELGHLYRDTGLLREKFGYKGVEAVQKRLADERNKRLAAVATDAVRKAVQAKEVLLPEREPDLSPSKALPQGRYFSDYFYQEGLKDTFTKFDTKIASMTGAEIRKAMPALAKKIAKADNSKLINPENNPNIALMNAYNKRLEQLGQATHTVETVLEKVAARLKAVAPEKLVSSVSSDQKAPLVERKPGDSVAVKLPTGTVLRGIIESIDGEKVKFRSGSKKYVQPVDRIMAEGPEQREQVVAPKPIDEARKPTPQNTVKVEEAKNVTASPAPKVEAPKPEAPKGASVSDVKALSPNANLLDKLNHITQFDPETGKIVVEKILDFVKERPDLDGAAKRALAEKLADKYIGEPGPASMKAMYDMAREGAPPLSTWRAEGDQLQITDPREKMKVRLLETGLKSADIDRAFKDKPDTHMALLALYRDRIAQQLQARHYQKFAGLKESDDPALFKTINRLMHVMEESGVAHQQLIDINNELFRAMEQKSAAKPPLSDDAVKALVNAKTLSDSLPAAGTDVISRQLALRDLSQERKAFVLEKAMQLYKDGLGANDPMALAKAREFVRNVDNKSTLKADFFGLGSVVETLAKQDAEQIPAVSAELTRIRNEQGMTREPQRVETLRTLPYNALQKLYDKFVYLNQNPNRFLRMFAPDVIKDFQNRTGIRELHIDQDPWKESRMAYGGGAGVSYASRIVLGKISREAADSGLLGPLKDTLNLRAYDRAIRNVQGKMSKLMNEAAQYKQQAKDLTMDIQDRVESSSKMREVVELKRKARMARADAREYLNKLRQSTVVPEGYTRAKVARDLQLTRESLGPENWDRVNRWADQVYQELETSWDSLHASGLISEGIYNKGLELGRGYIPLQRILDEMQKAEIRYSSKSLEVKTRRALQELEGSPLYNQDPFEAALRQIEIANKEVQKNNVVRSVLNLAGIDPNGWGQLIQPATRHTLAPNEGIIVAWHDGVKTEYAVPEFVASTIENASTASTAVVGGTLLRATASVFRTGATLANLAFSVPNLVRDAGDYAGLSKSGARSLRGIATFVPDWLSAFKSVASQDQQYLDFLRSRAGFSTLQRNLSPVREFHRPVVDPLKQMVAKPIEMASQGRYGKAAAEATAGNVIRTIETVEDFNDLVEQSTKLMSFKRNQRIGMSPKEAAWETRNFGGSPDFGSSGTLSPAINLVYMFFNANLQGTGRTIGRMISDPKMAGGLLGVSTLMAMAQFQWNSQYVRDDGSLEIDHVSDTDKTNYWYVMLGSVYDTTTGQTRMNYVKVPKPHWAKVIYNPIEVAVEDTYRKNIDWKQTTLDFVSNVVPGQFNIRASNPWEGLGRGALSSLNPILKEPIEQAANYDSYRGIPIEGKGMEDLENPEKSDPNTSVTAQKVTKVIYDNSGQEQGLAKMPVVGDMLTSPKRFEHAYDSFTTGVGGFAKNMADSLQGQNRNDTGGIPLSGNEEWAKAPVVGPIARRFVGSQLDQVEVNLEQEFYRTAESSRIFNRTFNHLAATDFDRADQYLEDPRRQRLVEAHEAVAQMEKDLGAIREEMKRVAQDNDLKPEEKMQQIKDLHEQKLEILRFFHEDIRPELETK